MTELTAYGLCALALVVGAYAGLLTLRERSFDNALFYAVALLEVLLVAQLVGGCIALAQTGREIDGITFVAYLVTVAVVPIVAVLWGVSDKSRWGTGVMVIGMVTVAVLCLRLLDLWSGRYA
ncbi:hypothetical protein [Solicola gregarius]|uniref:Uncharacterized protein n=1 Tax=Solicola gregarius TaxID=2908642 RepID=A0AA46YJZ4_9ACTN|nr:hypothetical protein [Solicola gregarius]UYM05130.1 hypothetical protein L0C25_21830 [Solicola gregarius]